MYSLPRQRWSFSTHLHAVVHPPSPAVLGIVESIMKKIGAFRCRVLRRRVFRRRVWDQSYGIWMSNDEDLKIFHYICVMCNVYQGCRKRGGRGGGGMAPHKIWTRGEKGPHFLALFGISAINQYFLVTLFPHRLNVPAHSNFSMRSHSDNHLLFRKK